MNPNKRGCGTLFHTAPHSRTCHTLSGKFRNRDMLTDSEAIGWHLQPTKYEINFVQPRRGSFGGDIQNADLVHSAGDILCDAPIGDIHLGKVLARVTGIAKNEFLGLRRVHNVRDRLSGCDQTAVEQISWVNLPESVDAERNPEQLDKPVISDCGLARFPRQVSTYVAFRSEIWNADRSSSSAETDRTGGAL